MNGLKSTRFYHNCIIQFKIFCNHCNPILSVTIIVLSKAYILCKYGICTLGSREGGGGVTLYNYAMLNFCKYFACNLKRTHGYTPGLQIFTAEYYRITRIYSWILQNCTYIQLSITGLHVHSDKYYRITHIYSWILQNCAYIQLSITELHVYTAEYYRITRTYSWVLQDYTYIQLNITWSCIQQNYMYTNIYNRI